ncbi:MAG: hypothetical protein ACXQS2_06495 [Methermicoccaceae archaeon]
MKYKDVLWLTCDIPNQPIRKECECTLFDVYGSELGSAKVGRFIILGNILEAKRSYQRENPYKPGKFSVRFDELAECKVGLDEHGLFLVCGKPDEVEDFE